MKRILTTIAAAALSCVMAATVSAQGGYTVKGVVVDQVGPVVGASVIEQGTANGTVTGIDGDYALKVASADACLLYTSPSPRDQRGSRMPSSA